MRQKNKLAPIQHEVGLSRLGKLILLLAINFLVGCAFESEDGDICIQLTPCESHIPATAYLHLDVSKGVREIVVRRGATFETGEFVYRGELWSGDLELPLGEYAVRARYVHGQDTLLAFDGGRLGYSQREECGDTCYDTETLNLDLSIGSGIWP